MSYITSPIEFPASLKKDHQKSKKYEWISLFYMISSSLFSFSVMSASQTMKTVWLEDALGILPPAFFLISTHFIQKKPTHNFPYGFHKVHSMAYLVSATALLILGLYLFFDGLFVLLTFEHPTIPTISIFGHPLWMGYLMMAALLWSSVPSTILGHIKIPLAKKLYDKVLYADSDMNKASWQTGFVSIIGIIGIGFGFWWADATVGIIISFNIIHDGYKNLKQAVLDLLDEIPKMIDKDKNDPLINEVKNILKNESWIKSFKLRFRDDGHIFFGELFVEPKGELSTEKFIQLKNKIENYHWRLHDIVIMPM